MHVHDIEVSWKFPHLSLAVILPLKTATMQDI